MALKTPGEWNKGVRAGSQSRESQPWLAVSLCRDIALRHSLPLCGLLAKPSKEPTSGYP